MLGMFGNSEEARVWEWNELVGELEGDKVGGVSGGQRRDGAGFTVR